METSSEGYSVAMLEMADDGVVGGMASTEVDVAGYGGGCCGNFCQCFTFA